MLWDVEIIPWHVGPLIIVYLFSSVSILKKMSFSRGYMFLPWRTILVWPKSDLDMRFWDPAGFTADGSVEDFQRRRQTELKHGRISMLATMGYITPEWLVELSVSSLAEHDTTQSGKSGLDIVRGSMTRMQPSSSHSMSFALQAEVRVICLFR